ncbi:MAG: hypothetical protein LHW45_01255 [Candidatus Cloacimonetes bacterium]|nr:hypothetical protein [Candidatus Cloacimonadota bacterium]MDY0366246.1 hypothetical protein [Candidatus Syntrophosphaera sp.]
MTGSTGSMGFIKTERQRDRVMYHKLQLVGCPRFISRHEGLVTEKRGKRENGIRKKENNRNADDRIDRISRIK